jgi:hypothetical protein
MTKKTTPAETFATYKGFSKDLQCHGEFQYEIGKTYVHAGPVVQCESGFHACQNPLDVLDFYGLENGNRFARVKLGGKVDRSDEKKWAAAEITIVVEIGLPELIADAIKFIMALCKADDKTLAASGDSSHLAASGDSSHLAASGDSSHLAASGYSSHLAASGDYSNLAASGDYSNLAASGDYSNLAASGYSSHLAASGYSSHLAASGDYSKLAASGDSSKLAASGDSSHLAASGYSSHLAASGDYSNLAASGDYSKLAASGDYSKLEISGKKSAAAAVGPNSAVKAIDGTPIAICEYNHHGEPIGFATGIVGNGGIEAGKWYVAKGGKLVEQGQ